MKLDEMLKDALETPGGYYQGEESGRVISLLYSPKKGAWLRFRVWEWSELTDECWKRIITCTTFRRC